MYSAYRSVTVATCACTLASSLAWRKAERAGAPRNTSILGRTSLGSCKTGVGKHVILSQTEAIREPITYRRLIFPDVPITAHAPSSPSHLYRRDSLYHLLDSA